MTIKKAVKQLKDDGQLILPSNRKGFDYFVTSDADELPLGMTIAENEDLQAYGTHITNKEVIEWANSLTV